MDSSTKSFNQVYPIQNEADLLLHQFGFKVWNSKHYEAGGLQSFTEYLQMRVDTTEYGVGIPLCKCNDKVCINVEASLFKLHGKIHPKTYKFQIVHEDSLGQWCELGVYSLGEGDLDSLQKIDFQVMRLIALWETFYSYGVEDQEWVHG